ncbi:hypothetical protein M9H77_31932 [Catharanthus roseus]|uniref:Uncharacterized protein n=1 Tax=Catharanthus roseus TaxID=4058 RepID=A0ACC0A1F9_CATRO|nr:hypothetical protein M9H77_31932 [Catharanthus roseus]
MVNDCKLHRGAGSKGMVQSESLRSRSLKRGKNHRVSSTAGKSERIKTHQRNFYTRMQKNTQCHSQARRIRSGSHNDATDSWGTYQVCPGTTLSFKPLLALHKVVVPPQSMMWCPRRLIGSHPPRYYAPLQVDPLSRV